MIYCKPIEYPPAPFQPGDRVRFLSWDDQDFGTHTVIASTHTHTQLENRKYAVANWQLKRVHKARQKSTEKLHKRDRKDTATIDCKNLPTSENLLKSTHP